MKPYYNKDELEAGVDDVGRGCLAGPMYTAAVVWPQELDPSDSNILLRDSKKLSKRKRLILKDYIEEYAIDYSVQSESNHTIDDINILNTTFKCMHSSLSNLNVDVDHILVDGDKFKPFVKDNQIVPYTCIIGGDDMYVSIAAASILAKVYHDIYIEKLCDDNPILNRYDWRHNMCYGTRKHLDAIDTYGITEYHRKTFGICKKYKLD